MKKSKILILLLIAMILTISAVSAADTDVSSDSPIQAIEETAIESADSDAADNVLTADNDVDVLEAGEGNFTELQNAIDASVSVILSKDYSRVNGEQEININTRDVTIIGNNHIIDAYNLGGIFNVAPGRTLTLMGVTLINGNNQYGGAINNQGTLIINDCKFFENTAQSAGGAIYNNGGSLTLTTVTFDSNNVINRDSSSTGGAAIYSEGGTILLMGSTVINNLKNLVPRGGTDSYAGDLCYGAIATSGDLTVTNSYFENNGGAMGGAISAYNNGVLTVSGSNFVDNTGFAGGAIYTDGSYTISNCNFTENKARGTGENEEDCAFGGAIATKGTTSSSTLSNCKFEGNTAANGGAISSNVAVIEDCTFTDNIADAAFAGSFNGQTNEKGGLGDAVYSENTISISNSDFENNGIYVKDSKVSYSSFVNSIIEVVNSGTLTVYNNTHANDEFDIIGDNSSNVYYNGLGDYPRVKDVNFYFNATSFTDLQAFINSGSIATLILSNDVTKLTSEREDFINGIEIDKDITIDAQGHTITANNNGKIFTIANGVTLTLKNANIIGDSSSAIVNNGQITLDVTSPNSFSNVGQYLIENNGIVNEVNLTTFTQLYNLIHMVDKGQLFIGKSKIKETQEESTLYSSGISINKFLSITGEGAVIDASSYGRIFSLVDGAVLFLNNITLSQGLASEGAAVYVSQGTSLIVSYSKFHDNAADRGGAIYSEGELSISHSEFYSNNIVKSSSGGDIYGGSSIFNSNGRLYILDTIFIHNSASYDDLTGTITTSGETLIDGAHFENNNAQYGAAITSLGNLNSNSYTLTVENSNFVNNKAENGGAIFVNASNLKVTKSSFNGNTASLRGGAIAVNAGQSSVEIRDSLFNGTTSFNGALSLNVDVDSVIDNCTFTNNIGPTSSALYLNSSNDATVTLSNSIFSNNGAYTIYNSGKLALSNNTVNKTSPGIYNDETGIITSYLNATILENATVTVEDANVKLTASVVDDNGNLIYDKNFNFTVNGVNVPAQFSINSNLYEANYTLPRLDIYTVGIVSNNPNVDVYTGTISYIIGTFTDLNNKITAAEFGFLELPYDFKYDENVDGDKFPEGIVINKNLYINGKGVTISGNNSHRIFKIDGATFLTLTNVTLINGSADLGGAVYVAENSAFTPLSINFINNTAIYRGGAIYSEGTLTVNGGLFYGNDISLRNVDDYNGGAAIYNNGGILVVKEADFVNNLKNIVVRNGVLGDLVYGAIFTTGETNITDSYFGDNAAYIGGAIAIVSDSENVIIYNNIFEENNATFGGAIYTSSAYVNISNCNFVNNKAVGKTDITDNQGGAIFIADSSNTIISASTFTDNSASMGGAVYVDIDTENVVINGCTFENNIAANGGAILNEAVIPLNVSNSRFTGNTASEKGNAILNNGLLVLSNNIINTESADIYDGDGIILSEINVVILDNETVTFSGTVLITAKIVDDNNNLIEGTSFKFVIGDTQIPAVYNKTTGFHEVEYVNDVAGIYPVNITYDNLDNLVIKTATLRNIKGTFTDLQELVNAGNADLQYDFAYVEEIDGDLFYDGIVFDNSAMTTINGNGHTIDAKNTNRIFNIGANNIVILNNLTLINGFADEGAAIYSDDSSTLTVYNLNFTNNVANNRGGAIYSKGYLMVQNSIFDNNDIINCQVIDSGGAAIYYEGGYLSVINSNFTNNLANHEFSADDLVAGAIFTKSDAFISASYFDNNGGVFGGAIYSVENSDSNPNTLFIRDSKFERNHATFGGAISVEGSNVDISASVFNKNFVTSQVPEIASEGGAIAVSGGSARITNSTFNINLGVLGGAISLNGVSESTIDDCIFDFDLGSTAGAIYANSTEGSRITVSNSKFTNNMVVSSNGSAIYNDGDLFLSGNVIDSDHAEIYNGIGIISSPVKAILLDNKTVSAEMGDIFILNATLVDDNGNAIYDSTFRFTVNNQAIESVDYDKDKALYTAEYYIDTAGSKIISTNCSYRGIEKLVGIIEVPKANVTLIISASDIVEGEKATITVNVYGINDSLLNTVVKVLANNTLHNVNVTNGEGVLEIEGLESGSYPIFVLFEEDDNYNTAYNSSTFFVKYLTNLTIYAQSVYDYGEVLIDFELVDSHDGLVTGVIIVNVGGETYNVLMDKGYGSLLINELAAGEYTVEASYEGSNEYYPSTGEAAFKVKQQTEFDVTIEGTYPDATVIIEGINGKYIVLIENKTYEVNVTRGVGILPITIGAGEYVATVVYAEENEYTQLIKDVPFTVEKADPVIETTITEAIEVEQEGVQIHISVPENLTGIITVDIDSNIISIGGYPVQASMDINVPSTLLTAGKHSYFIRYSGDNNYTATEVYKTFNVTKITPEIIISVEEDDIRVLGRPVIEIIVADDATGTVIIDNNGETIIAELTQGKYTFNTPDLQAGTYSIYVDYKGDDKYTAAYGEKIFEVPKAESGLLISGVIDEILGGQNFTFQVDVNNEFATGYLTVFVDGVEVQKVALDDGAVAVVSVPGLGSGNHTIGVKYDGDLNFLESDIYYLNVNVTKSNSTVTIDIPINETFDNYMNIIITVENETVVTVDVTDQDGNSYVGEFINGQYVLNNLPVGNYTVNVINAENEMFNSSSAVANFTIMKFDFSIDLPVNSSSTEITINTPKDATGLLLVDVNGQSYYAPVENGTATVTIPKLAPGNYTAKVIYTGDDKYGNQSTTKEITVPSNLPDNAVTIPETSETNSPTYSIKLPEDATGFFSVVADGKEYVAALKNGEASITVPNLAEGDHRIIVSYTGDDKYSSFSKETMLNIHIPVYKLTKNTDANVLYSATKSYKVLVTKDGKAVVGEKVTIKFNGKTYSVKTDSKGYATLKLTTNLKPKKYTITAEYKGIKVTNKVTIKNIIKIKNVKIKKTKKKATIKATLKKVNGKYVKGKKLKLKVNGMTFKAKTNKKGVATFKLNKNAIKKLSKTKKYTYSVTKNMKVSVKKPKYTYKVYYGKDVAKKTVTVR